MSLLCSYLLLNRTSYCHNCFICLTVIMKAYGIPTFFTILKTYLTLISALSTHKLCINVNKWRILHWICLPRFRKTANSGLLGVGPPKMPQIRLHPSPNPSTRRLRRLGSAPSASLLPFLCPMVVIWTLTLFFDSETLLLYVYVSFGAKGLIIIECGWNLQAEAVDSGNYRK